jgi:hypothetical protein
LKKILDLECNIPSTTMIINNNNNKFISKVHIYPLFKMLTALDGTRCL